MAGVQGEQVVRVQDEDPAHEGVSIKPVVWTTAICSVAAALGHGVLWAAYSWNWNDTNVRVPWQPVAGISLVIVAIVAFGGFYIASRRSRVAIASSFLLTFLVSLTFIITIDALAGATRGDAKEIFDDFRLIVVTIIGFYFGSETIVTVAKVIGVSRTGDVEAIKTSDRDLASSSQRPNYVAFCRNVSTAP